MAYARQVELVDLSNLRRSRPSNATYARRPPPLHDAQPAKPHTPPSHTRTAPSAAAADSPPTSASESSGMRSPTPPTLPLETREALLRACLCQATVDVDEVRRLVWAHGIPDATRFRGVVWKLLTGYLPPDRSDWESTLARQRARYWTTVHDVSVDPSMQTDEQDDDDHPLNDAACSQWREYFRDRDLHALIRRDANRTLFDISRFAALRDSLQRVLFVYAKRHPALGYRQGMHELAARFLLVFTTPTTTSTGGTGGTGGTGAEHLDDVEADAYYCLCAVLREMGTCYAPRDTEVEGIGRQLRELQALLRIKDARLEKRLDDLGIDPRFYGVRWMRLWLAHEFDVESCLRLWDSFLTAELRLPWVRYVCVAMLTRVRSQLLHLDFTACMKLLLNYPACDVAELLRSADRLRTSNAVIVRTARR